MKVVQFALVAALVAVALAAVGCGGDDEEGAGDTGTITETMTIEPGATLLGSVGPGFEIDLTTSDGQAVTSLPAGEYTIEVDDQSDIHNFHLTGPGVDEDSGVSETGQSTWTVTFEAGTYEYVCNPHTSQMNGSFEVTG